MEQDAYLINSAAGSKHAESTLLIPPRKDVQAATTDKSGTKAIEVSKDWVIVNLPTPTVPFFIRPPVIWASEHPSISEFVRKASEVQGVRCIVVEDVDEQIIHFSTFADPLTEQTRDAIYTIEANLIDSYPDLVFDFHLRNASETVGGTPTAIPGQRFFAVWGGLDENPRRTPQARQR